MDGIMAFLRGFLQASPRPSRSPPRDGGVQKPRGLPGRKRPALRPTAIPFTPAGVTSIGAPRPPTTTTTTGTGTGTTAGTTAPVTPVAAAATPAAAPTAPPTPYVPVPPFTGRWCKLTTKFGLPTLDKEGIINYEKIAPGYIPYAQDFTGGGRYIHPVFFQQNWTNLQPGDWDLLQPAIKLATAFLDDPGVVTFFNGMFPKNLKPLQDALSVVSAQQPLHTFEPNWRDLHVAHKVLAQMGPFIKWRIDNTGTDWAYTDAVTWLPANKIVDALGNTTYTTTGSEITITERFRDVLNGKTDPSQYQRVQAELTPYDLYAAKSRSTFFLTVTLLHELVHAWGNFVLDRYPDYPTFERNIVNYTNIKRIVEPFFRDGRITEPGHAFEDWIFGGTLELVGKPDLPAAAYGLSTRPFPGQISTLGLSRADPTTTERLYACKMADLHRFFQPTFWVNAVSRFGHAAFAFDRSHAMWAELKPGDASIYVDHGTPVPAPAPAPAPAPGPVLHVVNP